MPDVFISYAREDRVVAQRLAEVLELDGWDVFWDRRIEAGAEWNAELQQALTDARCVLVVWSVAAKRSFWVRGEAADAYEHDKYVPVRIDEEDPPRLFGGVQALSLRDWVESGEAEELDLLRTNIASRAGVLATYGNLEPAEEGKPLSDRHLHLVHSCWRVDKDTEFGRMPFQIHVIVFGHPTALARVESVDYHLPGYPEGHRFARGGSAERLFELKQLANGFCVVQATVKLRGQAKPLTLSRLVNMSERGPRLLDDFVARARVPSNMRAKMSSLEDARTHARRYLEVMGPSQAKQRLIAAGVPPFMAETAVHQAGGS